LNTTYKGKNTFEVKNSEKGTS